MPSLLVLSDNPDFIAVVGRGLSTRMRTFAAADGRQAATLLDEGVSPDVILIDSSPSFVPRWIDFVRESLHCTPRCPPLLLVRPETISTALEWERLEMTMESLTQRARARHR